MVWLDEYIEAITSLLQNEDPSRFTYAALEVRLALERICYERLRIAHEYIAHNDLRGWTPKYIVTTLLDMVDPKITSEFTLSMSTTPVEASPLMPIDESTFEGVAWVELGTQAGFDPKLLATHWQAMSSFLHARLPKSKDEHIVRYAEADTMGRKIGDALDFLKKIQAGTMNSVFPGETVRFDCVCGQVNKRPVFSMRQGELISCVKENCPEKYRVERCGSEYEFERLKVDISCHKCMTKHWVPFHDVQNLDKNQYGKFACDGCGEEIVFTWKLMQLKKSEMPASSN